MIQVRRYTYRDVPGWKVCGYPRSGNSRGWPVSIFCEHESAARRIAAALKENPDYQITVEDFRP